MVQSTSLREKVRVTGLGTRLSYSGQYLTTTATMTDTSIGMRHPGPPYKVPGPWKQSSIGRSVSTYEFNTGGTFWYRGSTGLFTWPLGVPYLSEFSDLSESEQRAHGNRMQLSARPSKPVADMAVALAELRRDGLPDGPGFQTWRARSLQAKQAGSEYLNVEFGWAPLIRDVRNFLRAVRESKKILSQYKGNANHWIKCRQSLPDQSKTRFDEFQSGTYTAPHPLQVRGSVFQTAKLEVWFSGYYRYWLPLDDSLISRIYRYAAYANKLFGLRITPEVLWEAAPWSWAADWFFDVGSVMETISNTGPNADVMKDGCLMWRRSWRGHVVGSTFNTSIPGPIDSTWLKTYQNRRLSTPWGFTINSWQDLTVKQLAIMGALGLSGRRDLPTRI